MENKEKQMPSTTRLQAPRTVADSWTRTPGIVASLPEDWEDAVQELKAAVAERDDGYSTKFVATVYEWGRQEFGPKAKEMALVELAEFWYEFA
jgi:uncharacterized protein HemY